MKKKIFTLIFSAVCLTSIFAQEAYLGEIRMFAGDYAPQGWMLCNGQTLQVQQYSALYAIIGTRYGGNGTTTFMLPNLCGRVPLGMGQGTGLTNRPLAQSGGEENTTLTLNQLPVHTHTLPATSATATTNVPAAGVVPAAAQLPGSGATAPKNVNIYASSNGNPSVAYSFTSSSGANQAHNNMMPYISINFIICVQGIFPPRQ